jgi:SAM-dependent methyltransferase
LDYSSKERGSTIDKVVSLAAFHHYDNYRDNTGLNGRLRAMREFSRILKPGGKVIIGDIATDTSSALYFDSLDTPKLCPGGHPHNFLNETSARCLCDKAGLSLEKFKVKSVPWTFTSVDEAQTFINTIHGSLCSKKESLEHAQKYLKFWNQNGKYFLEWSLFYLVAVKK